MHRKSASQTGNTLGPGAKQVPAPLRKTLGNFPPSPAPSAPPTQRAFESAVDCGCAAWGAPPLPGYRRPPPQGWGFSCSHRGLRNLVSCAQNKAGGTAWAQREGLFGGGLRRVEMSVFTVATPPTPLQFWVGQKPGPRPKVWAVLALPFQGQDRALKAGATSHVPFHKMCVCVVLFFAVFFFPNVKLPQKEI